jgi:hypothetical protein
MKKRTKNTRKQRTPCPECGSSLSVEDGHIYCTQNLFETEYPNMFMKWDGLSASELRTAIENSPFKTYDMYERWKFIDPETGVRTQFCCTYDPNKEFNPMTQSETILPDPAQTRIAETLLKRPLTIDEYYGTVKVPLISEKGLRYYGQVNQLVFPREYITKYKDPKMRTDFSDTPVIFTWKELEELANESNE